MPALVNMAALAFALAGAVTRMDCFSCEAPESQRVSTGHSTVALRRVRCAQLQVCVVLRHTPFTHDPPFAFQNPTVGSDSDGFRSDPIRSDRKTPNLKSC